MGLPKSIDYKKCIYGLTGPDGTIRYVGQARYAAERLALHKLRARKGTHPHLPVYIWMNEVGIDNVKVVILEKITEDNKALADELETKHIAEHRALSTEQAPLTNLSDGGSKPHLPSMLRGTDHPRFGAKNSAEHIAATVAGRKAYLDNMTNEEREAFAQRHREAAIKSWESKTEDEKKEFSDKVKAGIASGKTHDPTRGPHFRFHVNRRTISLKCKHCMVA